MPKKKNQQRGIRQRNRWRSRGHQRTSNGQAAPPPFQCPQGRLINSKSKPRVEDEAEKKGKRRSVEEEEEEEDDDDEDPAAARRLIGRYLILLAIYLDRES